MSANSLQLAPVFLPRPPPPARPPAPSLPSELLIDILHHALANTDVERPSERQQVRGVFAAVCRGWYYVAAAESELIVYGAHRARRLAALLKGKPRQLLAVKTMRLDFVDEFDEAEAAEEPEELYERSACFAEIVAACPKVNDIVAAVNAITSMTDVELGDQLLGALGRCQLKSFGIYGFCAVLEQAVLRLLHAWPDLAYLDMHDLRLLCHRPCPALSSLSLPALEYLDFPQLRPDHFPVFELLLGSPSPTQLEVVKLRKVGWPKWTYRAEAAALLDRVAPQLVHLALEDDTVYRTANPHQWAFEPSLLNMVNLRFLKLSPNLVHLTPFIEGVVVSQLVHLERLALPWYWARSTADPYVDSISAEAVVHCVGDHPSLILLHLPRRALRYWTQEDFEWVEEEAEENDVRFAEEWDSDDEELDD